MLGGDIIHDRSRDNYKIFEYLSYLKIPKFMVLGNHDYLDIKTVLFYAKKANIDIFLNEEFTLIGINFITVTDYKRSIPQIRKQKINQYTIFLSHNPDYAYYVNQNIKGIDL